MQSGNKSLTKLDPVSFPGGPVYAQTPTTWTENNPPSQPPLARLATVLEIPFRHKMLIVSFLLLGMIAGWIAIVLWPRVYQSEARMLIKIGRESVGLDPTATTGSTVTMQRTREEEVVSALEILESRHIAEVVVDRLGPDTILGGKLEDKVAVDSDDAQAPSPEKGFVNHLLEQTMSTAKWMRSAIRSAMLTAGIKDEIGEREVAVQRLQSSLYIHAPARTAVICVQAQSGSPQLAQVIVSNVIEAFEEEHLNSAYNAGSLVFFEQQSVDKERSLNDFKETRSKYMSEHRIVSIEAERLMLQQQFTGIDRDLVIAYGDLEESVAAVGDLTTKVATEDDEITASVLESNDPIWDAMREIVYGLEIESERAKATYSEVHPAFKKIQKQLVGARAILESQATERIDTSKTPNPEKIRLGAALKSQQTIIAGLRSEIAAKEKVRQEMLDKIDDLLAHESYLDVLDRDILQAETDLRSLWTSLEDARVNQELHQNSISNVNVFQPATFVERATSPNKRLLAFGFLLLGFTSGLGLAVVKEAASNTVRTREDLLAASEAANVISIPWIRSSNSIGRRFGSEFKEKCQSLISDVLLAKTPNSESRGRTIGVVGVDVGVGASTLAIHLALASKSECNLPTLLIDADARHRSVSKIFGLQGTPGLVELVNGVASHKECVQRPSHSSVEIVAAVGEPTGDGVMMADPVEIAKAIKEFQTDCELVILDLPAASQPDQATVLAKHMDFVIVVAESDVTRTQDVQRLLHRLARSETEVLGVFLNKKKNYLPRVLRKFVSV